MFGSPAVDLKINQIVDPKKGIRVAISKKHLDLESLAGVGMKPEW
jgi:hypothetical protein